MTALIWLGGLTAAVGASVSSPEVPPLQSPSQVLPPGPSPTAARLPKDTLVRITVDRTLRSDQVSAGDRFPIHLSDPVVIDGRTALPAGLKGEGEVIDAKKSGMGGSGGRLIVNARYLQCGQTRISLGKMHLISAGNEGTVGAVALAAVAGPFGMLVRGRNGVIAQGAAADAKVIIEIEVPAAC
ncbi:hypothetical protein G7078_04680 [Sphingomonas sinipercae]|uniref:Uncharacterized protein n=1 Tax=Sphingomonas sinipercae TaxID=2714944 RepID=A0A6G7ZME5_9SPHN|nr:hypothetical protein [Sphingomonas sinipercae]QIL02151.1 hypothetical protein G7078_04680 [Sphingomonas sinipercae]